ncbi:MAG: FecR domain-containing protein [Burkholderiales bacterium]|nr:FecR domain-containing protein [Burkholderiales bacterium]
MNTKLLLVVLLASSLAAGIAEASAVGEIKILKGSASVERQGQRLPASVGMKLQQSDVVVTGQDGAVGITFADNSLMSTGPNSTLSIDNFRFDSTTHVGEFNSTVKRGTVAVVSGKMVKQSPESMKIRTPSSIMGVRGTEFVIKVDDVR